MNESLRRIYAIVLRYVTLLLRSPPRLIETIYWPANNMLLMGFLNQYWFSFLQLPASAFHALLGATFLLEFYLRAQMGLMLVYVEEIYARNLPQLYASPLRPHEHIISMIIIMLLRLGVGISPALLLAWLLFGYNFFALGFWVLPIIACLVLFGIVCGLLVMSLLLRFGQSAEWFGWMLGWAFVPVMGVYYPLDVMPEPLRLIGQALPPSHIFGVLRAFSEGGGITLPPFLAAFGLNVLYLGAALFIFFRSLKGARQRGSLLNLNE